MDDETKRKQIEAWREQRETLLSAGFSPASCEVRHIEKCLFYAGAGDYPRTKPKHTYQPTIGRLWMMLNE